MKALFIIDILMWMFLTGMVLITILAIGEEIANKLPDSKFKRWWRKHIIGDFPYDSY